MRRTAMAWHYADDDDERFEQTSGIVKDTLDVMLSKRRAKAAIKAYDADKLRRNLELKDAPELTPLVTKAVYEADEAVTKAASRSNKSAAAAARADARSAAAMATAFAPAVVDANVASGDAKAVRARALTALAAAERDAYANMLKLLNERNRNDMNPAEFLATREWHAVLKRKNAVTGKM